MNRNFPEIRKSFGFGCMRLPMTEEKEVDLDHFSRMVDTFLENGFNYFDTAHNYIGGKSELALRAALTSRYPRDRYILTNKLSPSFFEKNEDIRPLFEEQLACCGVEYFDFYLMHSQNKKLFEKYKACRAYETALEFRKEGRIRHFGISFHDSADVLEEILTAYPEIEVVQLQFNYADYEDAAIQSRLCYEVCLRHGKPVIVMEPVKGGLLVNLPEEAKAVFDALKGGSYASYAIRYAASFENNVMVLSGMGNMDMMNDNIGYMKDFTPLSDEERTAVTRVAEILRKENRIDCTACRYCVDGCPMNIPIPSVFASFNGKSRFYYTVHTENKGKASDCIACGRCEETCPQHLPIRELLREVAESFEKQA